MLRFSPGQPCPGDFSLSRPSADRRLGAQPLPAPPEASRLRLLSAACGGEVELQDVDPAHFSTVLDSLSEAGCAIITTASAVRLSSDGQLTAPRPVVTQPYPGFPTDAQPPLMAACLRAKGTTVFTENIFTNRYRHAEEWRRGHARGRALRRGRDRASRRRVY